MPDQKLKCVDCNNEFVFTEGEQSFFKDRFGDDYTPPKRCKDCRKAKKERNNNGGGGKRGRK